MTQEQLFDCAFLAQDHQPPLDIHATYNILTSMLELNVWGPAFDLPSFDAECIAATVYLNLLLPQDQWSLIPAHDSNTSPSGKRAIYKELTVETAQGHLLIIVME